MPTKTAPKPPAKPVAPVKAAAPVAPPVKKKTPPVPPPVAPPKISYSAPEEDDTGTQSEETPKAAKTPKAPKEPKEPRETANGQTRPKEGTVTGRIWAIADDLSQKKGEAANRKEVIEACNADGINVRTTATQFGRWCRFNDVRPGRSKKVAAEGDEEAPTKTDAEESDEPIE